LREIFFLQWRDGGGCVLCARYDPVNNMNAKLKRLFKKIRLVALDFDGVFTDNRVRVSADGTESVICCRSDGIGLRRLRDAGVDAVVISSEPNPVVRIRTEKLGVPCVYGCENKLSALKDEAKRRHVKLGEVAYLGNDVNDADCLKAVGLPVVVADAWAEVKPLGKIVLASKGGRGAVRELCDMITAGRPCRMGHRA